jgi:hypothetical protein
MANFYVSTSGDDSNQGTKQRPFLTIRKGISALTAGDVLHLREGNYVESVKIKHLHGSLAKPVVIRSYKKEHATIDGSVLDFRLAANDDWKAAFPDDPEAHADEYVSCDRFEADRDNNNRINRGAFLDREPYTRLITYSRLEDLRAENQTFEQGIALTDEREGPEVTKRDGTLLEPRGKNPWVYMGPGLFFNMISAQVHIRLSHTTNNVEGIAEYTGETDPRKLRLAISSKLMTALEVQDSSFIQFENLSVRFGGEDCINLIRTKSLVFDHVQILAAGYGVNFGDSIGTVIRHCEILGGTPSWYFRSDRKAEYSFKDSNKSVVHNELGKKTSFSLLAGSPQCTNIEIYNCELRDAHDIILCGQDVRFHHNWIDNLNDDSLLIDTIETHDLLVFQNVFTRCLSAISVAGTKVSGPTYIYRNLFDLRQPTAGTRPKEVGYKEVLRSGQLFKDGAGIDGPLHLFQNTCLVFRPGTQASFMHYRSTPITSPPVDNSRRSFNNIFVAINWHSESDRPISHIPPPLFPGPTDGNCYFRMGTATSHLFLTRMARPDDKFDDLEELWSSDLFNQSRIVYPPGYEAASIEADPQFRRIASNGTLTASDDLRLGSKSPAREKGIILPADLQTLDPLAPSQCSPDIGCYQYGEPGLRVGVDGRKRFPSGPGGNI